MKRNAERLKELAEFPDWVMVGVQDASLMLGQHPQGVRRLYHDGLLHGKQNRPKGNIWFQMGDLRVWMKGGRK